VFRKKYDIDARVFHEVTEIDRGAQRVRVRSDEERWEPFDQLLIATGAVPVRPDLPGLDGPGVYGVNTLSEAAELFEALERHRPRRAVVVGGGYIGLEMAEAFCRRGLHVSLVDRAAQVMGTLDPDMAVLVSEALGRIGVELYLEEVLQAVESEGGRARAVVTENRSLAADVVVLGLGVRPNVGLAQHAGIPVGESGGVRVDDRMRTEAEGIWAAGDCVETFHRVSRKPFHVALGTVANKQGRVAGINLAGGDARFPGAVGTAVSKLCELEVARTGLQEKELRDLGWEFETARIESRTRAHYFPGSGKITVKLLWEKRSERLVGGQIVGTEGAAKRIDVLATAVTLGLTPQDLVDMDLSYAPPFSPVWDPVQTAARRALR
jgi:NADPH-dependent 2,4-dienoyl-CoA reductase/sulfur reductase-like enzyme